MARFALLLLLASCARCGPVEPSADAGTPDAGCVGGGICRDLSRVAKPGDVEP